jgi:hypothetical protein
MRTLLINFSILFVSAAGALAQTAEISGVVQDATNSVVTHATVQIVSRGTGYNRQTLTNDAGLYTFPSLSPGSYDVDVIAPGFKKQVRENLTLEVGARARTDFVLEVGSVEETVTVSGESPLINVADGSVGTVINRLFVENMPLSGRSFQALIQLAPGVVLTKTNVNSQGQFSVNGQRPNANYFTVDGVGANFGSTWGVNSYGAAAGQFPAFGASGGTTSLVSVDALQEFRIQTSTFAPEFGRMPGAQISAVSRSGSNSLHGSLYEYFRNDKLDANDWFANRPGVIKPPLRQNNFGGVLGGPVIHNRTFFFLSIESLLVRQPKTGTVEVPTLEARRIAPDPLKPFLNAYPVPNGPETRTLLAQFTASYSDPINLHAGSARIDHQLGSKMTLFGRYNYSPSKVLTRSGALSTIQEVPYNITTVTGGFTAIIMPTVNNDLRFNWSRARTASLYRLDDFGGAVPVPDDVFVPPYTTRPESYNFLRFGPQGITLGLNANHVQRQINVVETMSVTHSDHQLKFGADYRYIYPAALIAKYSRNIYYTTPSLQSLMTLTPSDGIFQGRQVQHHLGYTSFSAFAQDTWKASTRLTLTYGLRWEVNTPPTVHDGHHPLVLEGLESPQTVRIASAGTKLWETRYLNLDPRVGLAYRISQDSRTVLRAGAGLFHDIGSGNSGGALWYGHPPYGATASYSDVQFPSNDPRVIQPLAPNDKPPYGSIFAFGNNADLRLPYTIQWNVSLERAITQSDVVTASYVGAIGRDQLFVANLTNYTADYTSISLTTNQASSSYHALQLQYRHRLSRRVEGMAAYTWSHSIDNASSDITGGLPSTYIDPNSSRADSDFDVRHTFNSAISYDLPGVGSTGLAPAFTHGWSFDLLVRARTASPVDVNYSRNIAFGSYNFRPDLVPGMPLYLDDPNVAGGRRYNANAFQIPVAARQGTLGRNALRGFGTSQWDLAARRAFVLREHRTLQLRAEAFNLLNHPNFADPTNTLTSGLFGISTQMFGRSLGQNATSGFNPLYQIGGPRSMQLSLKLVF